MDALGSTKSPVKWVWQSMATVPHFIHDFPRAQFRPVFFQETVGFVGVAQFFLRIALGHQPTPPASRKPPTGNGTSDSFV